MFSGERIVLYVESSWTSPWVCAAHVVLREKGAPFTTALAMMRKGVGAIDLMRDRTFTGTAPVLQHGDFWLAESLAIVEYLEELFPQPRMLPADVRDRARTRAAAHDVDAPRVWARASVRELIEHQRPPNPPDR